LNAIFLDRRGRKRLTQRWQGLALAGGDGRSHGSRGHHGDGVFCVVVDFVVFLVLGERRGEKPLVEL
jgi:hypothetical protein